MKDSKGNEVKEGDKITLRDWKGVTVVQRFKGTNEFFASVPGYKMVEKLDNPKKFTLCDMSKKIKKSYTKQEVKKLMQQLIEEAQTFDLIEEQKWDNGDGYVDSNGFYLTKEFEKWFKENVK